MKHNSDYEYSNMLDDEWKILFCTCKKILGTRVVVKSCLPVDTRRGRDEEIEADDNTSRRRVSSQRRSSRLVLRP